MKKTISISVLVLVLCTFMFSKTTIVHWMHHSAKRAEVILNYAEEFMKMNPEAEIVVQTIPEGEYKTKLLAALGAGSGPSVAQIPSNAMTEFYNYGLIQPFPESVLSAEKMLDACIPATIQKLVIDGQLYGMPTDVQTIVLFYNPVLFERAGLDPNNPPKDWNEFMDYAKKLTIWKDGKMVQSGWGIGGYHPVIEMLMLQAGATFYDTDGKMIYKPEQLKGLTFMTNAILNEKVYVPEFGSRWTGFRQIVEGMVFGHGAMVGSFKASGHPDLIFKTALPPANPETGSRATTLTHWALVIMEDCPDAVLAAKWIQYITSPEAQKQWLTDTGELPSYKSVVNDPELQKDPMIAPILDSLNYAVPTFSNGWADPAAYLRSIAYTQIIDKGIDPETALKNAIGEINKYLDEVFGQF
jgi:multiple sugar transport system substrate-binding protein